jgi:ribosomal protein L30
MASLAAKLHAVTLLKSGIGHQQSVRDTLKALGLSRLHQTVVHKNTPEVRVFFLIFLKQYFSRAWEGAKPTCRSMACCTRCCR